MNISFDKKPIKLKKETEYVVIDALYIEDIKEGLSNLKVDDLMNEIKRSIFPYTDTPFAEYIPNKDEIYPNQIISVDENSYKSKANNINTFSTDSGVLLFINKKNIIPFITIFSYYDLINSTTDLLNLDYWKSITDKFQYTDIAIIVSSGIGSGLDFEGSGTYEIV